jgi:hypothetical protein
MRTTRSLIAYLPKAQYRFHYFQLNKSKRQYYDRMLEGFMKHADSIGCNGCNQSDAESIYEAIRMDVPELFFVKSIRLKHTDSFRNCCVIPEYRFNYATSETILQAIEADHVAFIRALRSASELEKAKSIHDKLASMVDYKDVDAPYSHEAPGALLYRIGVCEGIAKAFKLLADRVDLKSLVAYGETLNNREGHAWNLVEIDGCMYHMDVTFDSTLSTDGVVRYDYFALSDDEMRSDRVWKLSLPKCDRSLSYYQTLGTFFASRKALVDYLKTLPPGPFALVFQLPCITHHAESLLHAVSAVLHDHVQSISRGYRLTYNLERMVFHVSVE